MDLGLHGRAYLVSGGTRGLGRATAAALVSDGSSVVISGRNHAAAERAAADLAPADALGVGADNADPASAERLVAAAIARFGRIDGALISVGGPPSGSVLTTTDEAWRSSFESIFLGGIRLARTVATQLSPGGAIGFVLSTSVRSPIPDLAISNGLRAGLAMTAKTLADELGPDGVRVFGLLPGRIATDRVAELDAERGDSAMVRSRIEETIPLRRYGKPAEFARVAAFLLSPAASYLTGVMVPVDGGALRTL